MKRKFLFAALIIAFTGLTTGLSAQYSNRDINENRRNHHERIRHGVRDGELTRGEARHLRSREARFRHDRRMAMRDGVISKRERRHLRYERKRNSMAIYRHKHNYNNRY